MSVVHTVEPNFRSSHVRVPFWPAQKKSKLQFMCDRAPPNASLKVRIRNQCVVQEPSSMCRHPVAHPISLVSTVQPVDL